MTFDRMTLAPWGAVALLLATIACGSGSGGESGGGGSSSGGGSGGSSSGGTSAYGTFTIAVVPPSGSTAGYTSLAGKIYDGAYPSSMIWTLSATSSDGHCKLYVPSTPLCTNDCGSGACVATNVCKDYPSTLTAGPLSISGVGTSTLTVSPISGSYSKTTADYPPFAEGAAVTLAAPGSASGAPAFTVSAKGVAPLALSGSAASVVKAASGTGYQDLTLRWTAPGSASVATVHVLVDVSHHGGWKGKIECDAPDTGSLVIPASLVTQLVNLGVAMYPSVEVTRRSTGSATVGSGAVKLNVDSVATLPVTIEGKTCTASGDCASGSCDTTAGLCD